MDKRIEVKCECEGSANTVEAPSPIMDRIAACESGNDTIGSVVMRRRDEPRTIARAKFEGITRPRLAGLSAGRAEAALSANAWRPARPAFGRIAWNLPSLHDFVHRENAKPSNTYSRVGACQRG